MKPSDSCKIKKRFKTLKAAWAHAKQYGNRAYFCADCGWYHTSSQKYDWERAYD